MISQLNYSTKFDYLQTTLLCIWVPSYKKISNFLKNEKIDHRRLSTPEKRNVSHTVQEPTYPWRNLQIHQKHIKADAYKTLARPQIKYASAIWDPFTQENQNKIEMVQRRAARFACNNYRLASQLYHPLQHLCPLWYCLPLQPVVSQLLELPLTSLLNPSQISYTLGRVPYPSPLLGQFLVYCLRALRLDFKEN